MGMFDDVICRRRMPDGHQQAAYQTKDFNCLLDTYEITDEGRLIQVEWNEATKEWMFKRDTHFHGFLNFYTFTKDEKWFEYNAKFTNGQLVEIVAVV